MVVMSRTTQAEYATAGVPAPVWVAASERVDGMEGDADSIQSKIGSGRAFLKVVAYPWGVEFDVHEGEGTR